MPIRKTVLANGEIYHLFNHSIDGQPIFLIRKDYLRAVEAIDFYQYSDWPVKLSRFRTLDRAQRNLFEKNIKKNSKKNIKLLAYCLMPNHIHFLVKQLIDKGISRFMSNFTNSYTRYFNIRHDRKGHLFQASFKAVRIETDEQLIHVSRYIHLNPVVSFVVKENSINQYEWSSYPEYLDLTQTKICDKELVLSHFSSIKDYQRFTLDQVAYGKKLQAIKYLTFN